jgi:hypothetical protein
MQFVSSWRTAWIRVPVATFKSQVLGLGERFPNMLFAASAMATAAEFVPRIPFIVSELYLVQ